MPLPEKPRFLSLFSAALTVWVLLLVPIALAAAVAVTVFRFLTGAACG
jgi:hypothetical protein